MADRVPSWTIVLAALLDFLTGFFGLGWLVALVTGDTTARCFNLSGLPAVLLFALVIAYFVLARRVCGPIWQRILGARR